jgi:hypothetical protein
MASQMLETKLWRATEADVRDALLKEIEKHGSGSRFTQSESDEFGLRAWMKK